MATANICEKALLWIRVKFRPVWKHDCFSSAGEECMDDLPVYSYSLELLSSCVVSQLTSILGAELLRVKV